MSIELNLFLISLLVVFIAAWVQGALGMGFGQIAAAGLIWTIPAYLPSAIILMALIVAIIALRQEWQSTDRFALGWSFSGRIIGTLLAIPLLLMMSDAGSFELFFGVLLLIGVILSVVKVQFNFNRNSLLAAGTLSGVMGTITSVGAPPMGLVFQKQAAVRARPTLNAFFAAGATFSLIVLWFAGRFDSSHVLMALWLSPGFILGVWCSRFIKKLTGDFFRPLVLIFATASALALIFNALLQ